MTARHIIDLFSGPGGWCLGAKAAGLPAPFGIEWGDEECATRRAAGLDTLQGDIGLLDPRQVVRDRFGSTALDGLIASPPCQAWSMAGKGKGRTDDVGLCERSARSLADGTDTRAAAAAKCADPRSILVVEPLRWALDLAPAWMAWEQVPPVLSFWQFCAPLLHAAGYRTWTGILSAEQYGVPQTRKRAILVAARDGRLVTRPRPTHRRYLPPKKLPADVPTLFDPTPLAAARVHAEDHDLAPWVSMADALGWFDSPPVVSTSFGTPGDRGRGGPKPPVDSAANPSPTIDTKARSWSFHADAKRSNAATRQGDEPAPTITGGHDSGDRVIATTRELAACGCPFDWVDHDGFCACCHAHLDDPRGLYAEQGDGSHAYADCPSQVHSLTLSTSNDRGGRVERGEAGNAPRSVDAPAQTLGTRTDLARWQARDSGPGAERDPRSVNAPSFTVRSAGSGSAPAGVRWVGERPATTVTGDARVPPPGHKGGTREDGSTVRSMDGAERVTVAQAAVLQTFPADYPWQGSRSAQFRQVGNAVPPLLAEHVLRSIAYPKAKP